MPKKAVKVVNVIKIPNDKQNRNYPQEFPRMPRLYLEIIENKAKIKQDLINKEHNPVSPSNSIKSNIDEGFNYKNEEKDDFESESDFDMRRKNKKRDNSFERKKMRRDEMFDDNSNDDDNENDEDDDNSNNEDENEEDDDEESFENIKKGRKERGRNLDNESDNDEDEDEETKTNYSDRSSENLSVRLKELLDDVSDVNSESSFVSRRENFSRNNNKYTKNNDRYNRKPPTLSELQKRGSYSQSRELRDINMTTNSEINEEDRKREMLFKFDLLRKAYPTSIIPEYTIHTDYEMMAKSYDDCVRRLSLDSSVETYKTYLIYGFMGCEFVFGNFLKFDMEGFTQQQIVNMNSYEKLLIELGEKSYVPSGSKWPVEVRLFFVVIMNAAFFIVGKMIMKKTGSNIMNMINNMNNKVAQSVPPKKPKMKGPTIDMSDIPDLDEQKENQTGL